MLINNQQEREKKSTLINKDSKQEREIETKQSEGFSSLTY
jgi:hypothetical protein